MSVRKLVGYADDECIALLEKNGILGYGRNSQFSNWLRKTIIEQFGMKNPLKVEEMVILEKERVQELERKKNELNEEILKSTEKINSYSKKIIEIKKEAEAKSYEIERGKNIFNKLGVKLTREQIEHLNSISSSDISAYRLFVTKYPEVRFGEMKDFRAVRKFLKENNSK